MKKQLTGFARMSFGPLLYIVTGDVRPPAAGDFLRPVLSMLCGAAGPAAVIAHGGPGD